MADSAELERRVQALEDLEAVRQTKYDYWHGIDLKKWDLVADCFTTDTRADYGRPDWRFEGRDPLVAWLRANEGGEYYSVSHSGHNPQVKLVSKTHATGFFKLHDWVRIEPAITLRGWGHYDDEFVKEADGRWRISVLTLSYVYKEELYAYTGNEGPSLTPAMQD
jgi:hypothetical protein